MKKQFLLIPVMLLALASCDFGKTSAGSVEPNPGSIDPTVSVEPSSENVSISNTGTTAGEDNKKISLNALKSLFGSFTAKGTDRFSYESYSNEVIKNIEIQYSDEAVLIDDGDGASTFVNVGGKVGGQYLSVSNTIENVALTDSQGGDYDWSDFFGNDLSDSLRVSDFTLTNNANVFEVTNSTARTNIAKTLVTNLLYPVEYKTDLSPNVASMLVTVNNDVITNVKFMTEYYVTYDSARKSEFSVCDEYDLVISEHGTTVVEDEVTPYETYPEAAALNTVLKSLSGDVYVKATSTVGDEVETINYYIFDDLYYVENPDTKGNFGLSYNDTIDSIVRFSIDENGRPSADKVFEGYTFSNAGLDYYGYLVAAEMFEFKDGKYVTRTKEDAQMVANYLCVEDISEYVSKVTLEIKGQKVVVSYDLNLQSGGVMHCELEVSAVDKSVLSINLDGLNAYIELLATVPEAMVGSFKTADHVLSIESYAVILDEKEFVVTSVSGGDEDGVINGTYDGQEAKLEYGIVDNLPAIQVTVGEDVFVVVYDTYVNQLLYIFNVLGLEPIPEVEGADLYLANINYWQTYGYIIFQIDPTDEKGSFTNADLEAYVTSVVDNETFINISSMDSSKVFVSGVEGQTVAEFLDASFVITDFDSNDDLYLLAFVIYEGSIVIYLY